MADVAVESSAATAVSAGVNDDVSEVKEVSQENKPDATDASARNGHAVASSDEQSAAKSKSTAESTAEPAEEKSVKKGSKERNNAEDTKTPVKRKAKAVEKVSEEEDDEKQASPAKKKLKKEEATNDTEAESSKEKKAAKSKAKASDDEDDDDDDDEESEELKPGLLERPVVIEEGVKREKKKVQRLDLTPSADKSDSAKKVEFVEGSGEKLGELPRVEFQLQKTHADDLKPLHRLLYDRVGAAFEVKKNIRRFSGFTFSESSTEFQKKKEKLNKFTNTMLKSICEVLDIDRGGKKEEIIDRILNFLLKPHSSGKSLPAAKKRRRSSTDKSKKSKSKKSKSEKSKKKEAKSKEDGSGEGSDDDDEEEKSSADEDEGSQSESESDEDSKKKKKQTKKSTPAKKNVKTPTKTPKSADKSSAKKAPKKQTGTPKKKNTTPKKAKAESSDESGDEDEPLAKKNTPPTDDVLRNVIKKILKTANLEEVTMKTVCKQVYDKFPEFDLTSRKDFIKTTVKQILK